MTTGDDEQGREQDQRRGDRLSGPSSTGTTTRPAPARPAGRSPGARCRRPPGRPPRRSPARPTDWPAASARRTSVAPAYARAFALGPDDLLRWPEPVQDVARCDAPGRPAGRRRQGRVDVLADLGQQLVRAARAAGSGPRPAAGRGRPAPGRRLPGQCSRSSRRPPCRGRRCRSGFEQLVHRVPEPRPLVGEARQRPLAPGVSR